MDRSMQHTSKYSRNPHPIHPKASGSRGYRRALVSATTVLAMATGVPAAEAAPKRPPRVQEVLDHLKQHPMTVTSQPMQYESDPTTPLPACLQGMTAEDVVLKGKQKTDFNDVILALLYVACGGLDQAHNIITPLSWGSWTSYAGAPKPKSPAAREAAYIHALVHRQEGQCIGEFGSGFSNANYWYAAAGQHPIAPKLLQAAAKHAEGSTKLQQHVDGHGSSWSPQRFVGLCSEAASSKDPQLLRFCEKLMDVELKLLLDYCYEQSK